MFVHIYAIIGFQYGFSCRFLLRVNVVVGVCCVYLWSVGSGGGQA